MSALLLWLSGLLPTKLITDNGTPYLERSMVCSVLGVTVYLHRFVSSDPDRGWHDHPWRWAFSLVLVGSYLEHTRAGFRRVRWFNALTGDMFHRVVLEPGMPEVWTVFVHGRKSKGWGFMRRSALLRGTPGYVYIEHRDRDGAAESDAWAKTAPKGREVRA